MMRPSAFTSILWQALRDAIIDSVPEQLYTGNPICPPIHVACGGNTLTLNEDYETTYANNELAGDASITVRPLTQYYTGTIVKKFKISNKLIQGNSYRNPCFRAVYRTDL